MSRPHVFVVTSVTHQPDWGPPTWKVKNVTTQLWCIHRPLDKFLRTYVENFGVVKLINSIDNFLIIILESPILTQKPTTCIHKIVRRSEAWLAWITFMSGYCIQSETNYLISELSELKLLTLTPEDRRFIWNNLNHSINIRFNNLSLSSQILNKSTQISNCQITN